MTMLPYEPEDFAADLLWLGSHPKPPTNSQLSAYFRGRYPELADAARRMILCESAFGWWEQHRAAFDRGSLSVVGQDSALVGRPVLIALWFYWTKDEPDFDPPESEVAALAQTIQSEL